MTKIIRGYASLAIALTFFGTQAAIAQSLPSDKPFEVAQSAPIDRAYEVSQSVSIPSAQPSHVEAENEASSTPEKKPEMVN